MDTTTVTYEDELHPDEGGTIDILSQIGGIGDYALRIAHCVEVVGKSGRFGYKKSEHVNQFRSTNRIL